MYGLRIWWLRIDGGLWRGRLRAGAAYDVWWFMRGMTYDMGWLTICDGLGGGGLGREWLITDDDLGGDDLLMEWLRTGYDLGGWLRNLLICDGWWFMRGMTSEWSCARWMMNYEGWIRNGVTYDVWWFRMGWLRNGVTYVGWCLTRGWIWILVTYDGCWCVRGMMYGRSDLGLMTFSEGIIYGWAWLRMDDYLGGCGLGRDDWLMIDYDSGGII